MTSEVDTLVEPMPTDTQQPPEGGFFTEVLASLPEKFDLTNPAHHHVARALADQLLEDYATEEAIPPPDNDNVFAQLSWRMARAKKALTESQYEGRVLVGMNLLHEHNRLRPATPDDPDDNPHGEDSLLRKVEEIEWLTEGTNLTIDLLYVSGGDPWDSESVLEERMEVARQLHPNVNVRLVRADEVPEWEGRNRGDKGGEWNLAVHMMVTGQLEHDYDSIYLTDADTTFNLAASLGEAVVAQQQNNWEVVLGDRKLPESKTQKDHNRSGPGAGWYYFISKHLGRTFFREPREDDKEDDEKEGIQDTQCPSRLYNKEAAQLIDQEAQVDGWAVETDHNHAFLAGGIQLHVIPVVAVDSEKESVGFSLPLDDPHPAFRIQKIIDGQMQQLERYGDHPALDLPHIEESRRMAEIVRTRLMAYDPERPWKGLAKLFEAEVPGYTKADGWEVTRFTPKKITIEEFERVLDFVLGPPPPTD